MQELRVGGAARGPHGLVVECDAIDALRIEPDRRQAIRLAIREARPGDVIVIAGKGHETTQTIGDTATPFDDRLVAREVLAEITGPTQTGEQS